MTSQPIKPRHCFCHYDIRVLLSIYQQKFIHKRSTIDLMQAAASDTEKDCVAIVSLLDVDDTVVENILEPQALGENCHILSCRDMLRHQLQRMT